MKIYQKEFTLVGAGKGGGFTNTKKLHVMKYKHTMQQPETEK
jgi:hypothetical protein